MKREMRDAIPEVGGLDYAADFADDGVDGGGFEEVYKVQMALITWLCWRLRSEQGRVFERFSFAIFHSCTARQVVHSCICEVVAHFLTEQLSVALLSQTHLVHAFQWI